MVVVICINGASSGLHRITTYVDFVAHLTNTFASHSSATCSPTKASLVPPFNTHRDFSISRVSGRRFNGSPPFLPSLTGHNKRSSRNWLLLFLMSQWCLRPSHSACTEVHGFLHAFQCLILLRLPVGSGRWVCNAQPVGKHSAHHVLMNVSHN